MLQKKKWSGVSFPLKTEKLTCLRICLTRDIRWGSSSMGDQISSSPSTQARRRLIHRGRASEEGGGGMTVTERGQGGETTEEGEEREAKRLTDTGEWNAGVKEKRVSATLQLSWETQRVRERVRVWIGEREREREREREQHKPSVWSGSL